MTKTKRNYMTRRGRRYLIERNADGTFGKFVPLKKGSVKRSSSSKVAKKAINTRSAKRA